MAETSVLGLQLPYTGIPLVDAGFTVISQQLARTSSDLQVALGSSGGGSGGTSAPTNAPTPTGITVSTNSDGSMDITLNWNYSQGTIAADFMVLFWKQGAASLAAPVSSDKAILLAATARSFTFQGWNPNSNYRFAIATGRKSDATTAIIVGNVIAPTAAPDWADISATGDYTGLVSGTAASTLVTSSVAGQTAFNETVNYRTAGAPTNNPIPASLTSGTDSDGSARYTAGWSYTQGARKADGFFFFVKEGDTGSFALTDPHFELGAQNAGTFTAAITLKGYPSDRPISFGVAGYRRTEAGLEIGPIQTSAASPDWQGITTGTPNYAGAIFGLEQHNFLVRSVGGYATGTEAIQKDGQDLIWVGRDKEFLGAPGSVRANFGLNYNLTVYDLTAKQVHYQHCFDIYDYTTLAGNADVFTFGASGGTAIAGASGKWGYGFATVAAVGQTAFAVTAAPSTLYADLKWVELWFRKSSGLPIAGTILSARGNGVGPGGYDVPLLQLRADGKVNAFAWDGAAFAIATSTATVNDGNWHHLAASTRGGNLCLWVDGQITFLAHGSLTSFSMGAPGGGLSLLLGYSDNGGAMTGTAYYDELIVSTNDVLRVDSANFTPPTQEMSDYVDGLTGTHAVWHMQEPASSYYNSRKVGNTLVSLLESYILLQSVTASRYLFVLQGGNDPSANRLLFNLPATLEKIGSSKALFTADTFQPYSAYILVGEPGKGPGNGLEAYRGKIPNDPEAVVEVVFQTQADKVLGGTGNGWSPLDLPGVPTNAPTPVSQSVTSSPTGEDVISIGWSYTQPALNGDNKLADGFVVFVKSGDTGTPSVSPTASYQVGVGARSFTMQAPYGQSWSFAVAPYRKTANGIETGAAITSAAGPDWQGIGGATQVTTTGIADANVTTNKVADLNVTTPKIANDNVTTAKRTALSSQSAVFAMNPANHIHQENAAASYTQNSYVGVNGAFGNTTTVVFTHGLGKAPSVVLDNATTFPAWPSNPTSTTVAVVAVNFGDPLGTSVAIGISYW